MNKTKKDSTVWMLGAVTLAAAALASSAAAATVASGNGWIVTNDHVSLSVNYYGKISVTTCVKQSNGDRYSGGSITYSGGSQGTRTATTARATACGQRVSASMTYKDTLSFTAPRTRMTDSLNRAPVGAVGIPVDRVVEVEVR